MITAAAFAIMATCSVYIPPQARIAHTHNNPGNLVWVKGVDPKWKGEPKRGGGHWRRFPSKVAGFRGILRQIELDVGRKLTLRKFIAKWAPRFENNTSRYLMLVQRATFAGPNTPLSHISPHLLARAVAWQESRTVTMACGGLVQV